MNEYQKSVISIKLKKRDKELIKKVADDMGIGFSVFCRQSSLQRAKKYYRANLEEDTQ